MGYIAGDGIHPFWRILKRVKVLGGGRMHTFNAGFQE
jgi:hypothetical protein